MADYNKTLNLPQTEFPMRAGLPKREPEFLKKWTEEGLYQKLVEQNKDKPRYTLHDGPPFSNGFIHMGTRHEQGARRISSTATRCHVRLLHAVYPGLGQPRHAH